MPITLIGSLMGSIYAGIATVTEETAIGAAESIIVALRRKELTRDGARHALWNTTVTTGSIIWLIVDAVSLVGIYNLLGGLSFLKGLLTGMDVAPIVVVLIMMAKVMPLGTFMDWIAIVFITVPVDCGGDGCVGFAVVFDLFCDWDYVIWRGRDICSVY